ncbi:CDK-activating kinase assembly factor MAT1-domain-containing protein [Kockovaella imperatae]|uniref:RNA polymerase II transcription factor B subunit 3 n=1 Tax=Kockovaella imperatae TaxID=4999 RepID=A0A1Y1UQ67_9TREE|nr:CDK-activating kinase assembly factor MAT1-domain-containing protein [Kockovaella imperatae]ORX39285.1 CDK-activating kinase assembly factor MAT1-domain-containing protein [Kockovaella imperatae]
MSRMGPTKGVAMRVPKNPPGMRKPTTASGRYGGSNRPGGDDGYLYVAGIRDPSHKVTEFKTESDVCPVCHTDRQFNKNLRLLISPCYHKMCESCIDRLFTLGPEPCPQCGRILRKVNFAHQTFEDLKVEKEVSVRRRMAKYYNKNEKDFATKREYNDYLEEAEDITFNLLNDIDVEATEARITEFARKNAEIIAANEKKRALEMINEGEREEVLRKAKEERARMVAEYDRKEEIESERIQQEVLEAVARGDHKLAQDIESRGKREAAVRAEALAAAIPPSIASLLTDPRARSLQASAGSNGEHTQHQPGSPSYSGRFVAYPYSDPSEAPALRWFNLMDDYVDYRPGVIDAKRNKDGKYRGGGFDLGQFWEMEIRTAVEALGIEPLV